MASGHTQLVIVDGPRGYVLMLATNAFVQITDPDWPGADQVEFLDGFFIFTRESSEEVYVSAIDDATSIDALDFASAESYADPVMAVAVRTPSWSGSRRGSSSAPASSFCSSARSWGQTPWRS